MKIRLSLFCLFVIADFANAADKPIDLTGADADKFRSQLGHIVTLQGRLEMGMQGPCLHGATATNVVFYIIPDMPASGSYSYPETWTRLLHQQVRVTGKLNFRSFNFSKAAPTDQTIPDYYYIVLQRTSIERVESK